MRVWSCHDCEAYRRHCTSFLRISMIRAEWRPLREASRDVLTIRCLSHVFAAGGIRCSGCLASMFEPSVIDRRAIWTLRREGGNARQRTGHRWSGTRAARVAEGAACARAGGIERR